MRKAFSTILDIAEGPERTAALTQWVQSLFEPDLDIPILVGGGAVELYTGGAYTTGDLDFVGNVPTSVSKALTTAGFTREGRHWIHEEGGIFLEFPSSALDAGAIAAFIEVASAKVLIISPEDLIVDRLAAWKFWVSPIDGVNAYLLYRIQYRDLDLERLRERAEIEDVSDALRAVDDLYDDYYDQMPPEEVLEQWAKRKF
jgi:hypothetical protein